MDFLVRPVDKFLYGLIVICLCVDPIFYNQILDMLEVAGIVSDKSCLGREGNRSNQRINFACGTSLSSQSKSKFTITFGTCLIKVDHIDKSKKLS